jgi:predicted Rdx family selenoprotein
MLTQKILLSKGKQKTRVKKTIRQQTKWLSRESWFSQIIRDLSADDEEQENILGVKIPR